jgi:regulator of RNase E activity RraA
LSWQHEIAGLVIDGATRDVEGMQAIGFPVFARATFPPARSRILRGPSMPVSCAGARAAGDIIIGDS